MGKQRKTLKQKKIADLRHNLYSFDSKIISSLKTNTFSEAKGVKNVSQPISLTNKYPYLIHDISKTGILTGLILIAQIILFFLLKKHILLLPMVKY